ncbi:hypothetical protein [Parapedobacter soli]|uniref:hypothetical protein n=1 Tax=Parapedobacter soli TaxID=416955 RepID=UPI0021C8263F|nr:hypothetical protein [Parapedobacter soli]
MKTKRKLSHKHFRYLTKKEFKDPLYAIADFCRSICSLSGYKKDIKEIIYTSNASPHKRKPIEISNLLFSWRQLVKHIELLYVLSHRKVDWTVHPDATYHKQTFNLHAHWVHDETLYNGAYLNFERLKLAEMRDIGIFIKKFFNFKSLREWYRTMDEISETFFEEYSLSDLFDYADDQAKIFKYLEKIADTIFLIYATRAREHIFKYHIKEFALEKYLEKEASEAGNEASEQAPSAAENPASDETDDDA